MTWTQASFGRFTLAFMAAGFAMLLALGGGMVWLVQETRGYAADVIASQQIRVATGTLRTLLQDAETSQRGYLLTSDAGYVDTYHEAEAAILPALVELGKLVRADSGQVAPPGTLRARITAKIAEMRQTMALFDAGQRDAALALVRGGDGRRLMEQIEQVLDATEQRSMARQAARSKSLAETGAILLFGASGGLLLIALLSGGSAAIALRYTRDLTEAEANLRLANASLEQRVAARTTSLVLANEEIQRFAYIVSHDLRAPLVNVMGFTQELEAAIATLRGMVPAIETRAPDLLTVPVREALEADIPEAIGFIRSSTNRMDRLIGAILALSREGRRRLAGEPVVLGGMLESLGETLRHQLDAAGAELRLQGPFPTITTDRLALEQILGNLLDNAVKYLGPDRAGRILVRARRQDGLHAIDVVDNGRGIAPRDHERVFELFRRSGVQDRPGEGIGLAHVRALARRLGGDVLLESALGTGSTFTLILPDRLPVTETAPAHEDLTT